MGKKILEDQAKILAEVAPLVYLKHDTAIKENLKGTKQAEEYEAAKRRYNIDGCADAISDMASTLRGIARRLPRRPIRVVRYAPRRGTKRSILASLP